MAGKRVVGNNLCGQLKTFAESETRMPALERRILQGGDTDLKTKKEVAFNKLFQDVLKKAGDTQRNLILKEVEQLIAGALDVTL